MSRPSTKTAPKEAAADPADAARAQLARLDVLLDEVANHYVDRLHREIGALRSILDGGKPKGRLKKTQLGDLRQVERWCKELSIRGDRGRRKDLKKIDALIGDIQSKLEKW